MRITTELAELSGIILGDGHIHIKANLITIVGSLDDYQYFQERVCPLIFSIFSIKTKIRKRKDRNAYYVFFYSKEALQILTETVGLQRGNKKKALLPTPLLTKELLPYVLRGLFDTDGCLKFSKQGTDKHYYPRIQISLQKSPLAYQLRDAFNLLEFSFGIWEDNRFGGQLIYQISGEANMEKWFCEVSPKNPVHISKFIMKKQLGYFIPKLTLQERKNIIEKGVTI